MNRSQVRRTSARTHFVGGLTLPAGIYALLAGRASAAPPACAAGRPRRAAVLLLGELLPWVMVIGAAVLSVVRGAFYGFVDDGPYDDSWGGPTRAGAWLAHFGVGLLTLSVAALMLVGLGALRARLERPAYGDKAPRWAVTLAVFLLIFSVYLLGAWIAQI